MNPELTALLAQLKGELKIKAAEALANISSAAKIAVPQAIGILKSMVKLGTEVVVGKIRKEVAEEAINNYFLALKLIEARIETEAKKELYRQAVQGLTMVKELLFAGITIGLNMAGAGAAAPLLKELINSLLPEEKPN